MEDDTFLIKYGDVLTPVEVMKVLRIGRNAVYRLLASGAIPSIRIAGKYRIPKKMLIEFLSSQESGMKF